VGVAFPEDDILQSIIRENQNICSRVGSARGSD
jgi:hypothetical protein